MIIFRIAPRKELRKPRVAAYCRVSTGTEEQAQSYQTQIAHYARSIWQNTAWAYAGVYADYAKTATDAERRPEFMRMMADAKERRFDLLLVKAISRFSRNVVDAQRCVNALKRYDVEVRFENEGISSFDPASEMMFNILAVTAQQESKNKSEHVRWTYRHFAEQGIRRLGNHRVLGYDEINGHLTPNADAWIVQLIFTRYAQGATLSSIVGNLTDAGAKRLRSDKPFTASVVWQMLKNEIYVGDRLLQKQAPHNYLTKRPDPTVPYTHYYITNDHPPLVDRDTWNAVRDRLTSKKSVPSPQNTP